MTGETTQVFQILVWKVPAWPGAWWGGKEVGFGVRSSELAPLFANCVS